MDQDKDKKNIDWIVMLPVVILIAFASIITKYNIIYTTLAGLIGVLIGLGIKLIIRKK